MKKLVIMIAVLLFALPVSSFAAGSDNLSVSATVVAGCRFQTGGTLNFGTLFTGDNLVVSLSASSQPTFFCTSGAAYTISNDSGLYFSGGLRMSDGTDFIPYSITYTASAAGTGAIQTMDINGTIAAGAYSAVGAGAYADTVVLSIIP